MGRLTGDADIDGTDPGLADELRELSGLAHGGSLGAEGAKIERRILAAAARATYLAAVIQSRSARRADQATRRLVRATWILALATVGLVVATGALIWVTAHE